MPYSRQHKTLALLAIGKVFSLCVVLIKDANVLFFNETTPKAAPE